MLTVESEIWPFLNKLSVDLDEMFRIALQLYEEQLIKVLGCRREPFEVSAIEKISMNM